jgi:2-dehydro-3-deoxygluconokinase
MNKIICFGELLLHFSPAINGGWIKEASMPVCLGGAELNVARALALWKLPVKYCTALPDNYLSADIINDLTNKNIDVSAIKLFGDRAGIYFLPADLDLKNDGLIYDRSHTSFSYLRTGMLDWEEILKDVSWFHFSAISPALSQQTAALCKEALKAASKRNITISMDLNHRSKLWKYTDSPVPVMQELAGYCNVIMGNIWSAETLLGIKTALPDKAEKEDYLKQAAHTSQAICKLFSRCTTVANTFRFDNTDGSLLYYASLWCNGQHFNSPEFHLKKIISKVGTGDSFMAGLIYSLYNGLQPEEVIRFSTSAGFGKFQESGDAGSQDVQLINSRIT